MIKYQFQQENVFINHGKTLATLCAFSSKRHGIQIGKTKFRYEIRAGRKGTGRTLAKATCVFLASSQERATKKIAEKVGGIEWFDYDKNREKFEKAGYIPDPFER